MNDLPSIDKWKRKRSTTYMMLLSLCFLNGAENSANVTTIWIYIRTLMKTDHPMFFYGLINTAYFIPALTCSAMVARWADKTRRIKCCLIIAIYINMVGSILYIIPSSPFYAVAGKCLQGFSAVVKPLILGEIARSYTSNELQQRMPFLDVSYTIGFSLAPVVNTLFEHTDFWIGGIHITYGNVSGLVFLILYILLQVLVVIFAHDLSREYDLKQNIEDTMETNACDIKTTWIDVLKKILKNYDTLFLMFLTLYSNYLDIAFFRMLPVLIIENLQYSYTSVNMSFTGFSIIHVLLSTVLVIYKVKNTGVFYCGFFSFFSVLIMAATLLTFSMHSHNFYVNVVALVSFVVALSVFMLGESIFTQVIWAKFQRSTIQSYAESIRYFVMRIGTMLGACTIGYILPNLVIFSAFLIVVTFCSILLLLTRRTNLINASPVI